LKRVATLLLTCAATACASIEALPPPADISPSAAQPFIGARRGVYTDQATPVHWWRLYDDPVLDALIAQAFAENKDLEIAAANLQQVRASLKEAQSLRLPTTTTSATVQRQRLSAFGSQDFGADDGVGQGQGGGSNSEFTFYDVGLDVSYELDFFGRIGNTIRAARADTDAAQAALDVVRITVAAETARAYADACAANATIAVAVRTAELLQSTLTLTQALFAGGTETRLAVASAASQLHATQAAIPPLRAALDEAVFRLATLTGRTPAQSSAEARACLRIPQVRQPIPVGDGALLLARRPDIRQAEGQLRSAAARVGVAWADLFPTVTLGGSIGSSALELSDLGSSEAFRYSIGPLITWSFPNLVAAQARLEGARAGRDGFLANFEKTVLVALQETETALSAYANELDRRTLLLQSRDESAEAANLARVRYEAGVDSYLNVVDAQRALADAEARLADSEALVADYQIAVFKALGGGWESAPPAATVRNGVRDR
jgi:NodT family efflux transporter outer membrane factor (OMF) lipoprotein